MRVDEADLGARARTRPPRTAPSVRVSCPVELLRRPASARVDRPGAREGLGRAARRGGLRADQPARPRALAPRLRRALLLQDLRLPDRRRLPAGAQAALAKLRRPWFAGGTITVASVQGDRYYLAEGEAAFEDGTLDYLALPAVEIGLQHIESIGHRHHPRAGPLPDRMAARQSAGAPPDQRPAARAHLRPAVDRSARRHGDVQLL